MNDDVEVERFYLFSSSDKSRTHGACLEEVRVGGSRRKEKIVSFFEY